MTAGRPRARTSVIGTTRTPRRRCSSTSPSSHEEGEVELLRRLGVRVVPMTEVRARGLPAVMEEALAIVTRGTLGYGVTIDLDGFEPSDAPGIGLKEPNGLRRGEMLEAL